MKPMNLLKDDSAVAVSLGFILMFAVSIIVFSTIVLSFYDLTENMKEEAMRESFRMLGSRVSIELTTVDMILNATNSYGGTVNALEYEFTAPASIASEGYTVNITNATNEIILESEYAISVTPFNVSSEFNGRKLYSGAENYKFSYDSTGKTIYIEEI